MKIEFTVRKIISKSMTFVPRKKSILSRLRTSRNSADDDDLFSRLIFSDEATFHTSGKINKHNCRVWGTQKRHRIIEHERDSPKVNVFCALSQRKLYGPFFFIEATMTGHSYLDMLEQWSYDMIMFNAIETSSRKSEFAFDLCKAFLAAEIPLWKVQGCGSSFKVCHSSLSAVMWLADEPREFNLPTLPQRRITYVPEKLPSKYGVHSQKYLPIHTHMWRGLRRLLTYFVDINMGGQHGHGAFDLYCGMLPYATDDNKHLAYDLPAQNTVRKMLC
ncbi:hypothetical protein ANN_07128 [Periplaneta americana]|uniref:Uncharacterized protein n=1 Tax=Periplaneta americana TaxID=6978 RepID=A0ABQ8THG4_PERAM|nr:hypothetical protein ANN_07128 [Periplaneta americana]